MRSAVLAVIIGSLCFSVGEGLRLTPFPVAEIQDANGSFDLKATSEISLSKYGPLDVPTQNQKRSKRQSVDPTSPTSTEVCQPFTSSIFIEDGSVVLDSIPFVPHSTGRAPPILS